MYLNLSIRVRGVKEVMIRAWNSLGDNLVTLSGFKCPRGNLSEQFICMKAPGRFALNHWKSPWTFRVPKNGMEFFTWFLELVLPPWPWPLSSNDSSCDHVIPLLWSCDPSRNHVTPLLWSCDPSFVIMPPTIYLNNCTIAWPSCDHAQAVGRGWVHSSVDTTQCVCSWWRKLRPWLMPTVWSW